MGLMSRRVVPACGALCVCCPALRSRSRKPVKRYDMLLADLLINAEDEAPSDRKIGKLVEYASQNPLRIPKISSSLEQRGLKELKNEHFGTVATVMRVYSKLFIACRNEMSLIASNALNMIKALLEQSRHDNMRILGCTTLVDFIRVQTDAAYMRYVDGLVSTLCALACEHGEEKKRLPIRAAALQALAAMVGFMADPFFSSADFDQVVAAALENYEISSVEIEAIEMERGEPQRHLVKGLMRLESHAMTEVLNTMYRNKAHAYIRDPSNLSSERAEAPSVWSQICLQNMAALAKEANTVQRVLDPMFRYFDSRKHWSLERGIALVVLQNMQFLMDQTGNGQLLLASLVRHLDHKNVNGDLVTKRSIVGITSVLARQSKAKATVAEMGAMSDLSKHLRKSLQGSMETLVDGSLEVPDDNILLQATIEECLMEIGRRVGDAGPLLDMMAATLEKLSSEPLTARSTLQAVSVLALAVAYLPDHLYSHQEFPESLFVELLRAMLHPDMETRVGAHRTFVLLLVPSSVSQSSRYEQQFLPHSDIPSPSRGMKRVSAFSSAAALFERLRLERRFGGSFLDSDDEDRKLKDRNSSMGGKIGKADSMDKDDWQFEGRSDSFGRDEDNSSGAASPSRLQAFRLSFGRSMARLRRPSTSSKDTFQEMTTARLNGHQSELLFSALWLQAKMENNWPSSYEAMAHTYSLALLFSRPRSFRHYTQLRAMQLALSIRNLAIDSTAIHSLARRRSLFTLATGMLVFAAKCYNIPQIVATVKEPLTSLVKDPFLELSEDSTLTAVSSAIFAPEYATESDDTAALSSLNLIPLDGDLSNEAVVDRIVESCSSLAEVEGLKERLGEQFTPEDGEHLGPRLYPQSLNDRSTHASLDYIMFDESQLTAAALEDESCIGSLSDLPPILKDTASSLSAQAPGVSQLLDEARFSTERVGLTDAPGDPLSYNTTASQCEVAGADAYKKMAEALKLASNGLLTITLPNVKEDSNMEKGQEISETRSDTSGGSEEARTAGASGNRGLFPALKPSWLASPPARDLRLPPSSPYDNFLRAAGC